LGAQYTGDANYTSSAPFDLSAASNSATISAGGTAQFSLAVAPVNGFSGTVTLACSGTPAAGTCTLNPTSAALSGSAANVTVSVATTARSSLSPLAQRRAGGGGAGRAGLACAATAAADRGRCVVRCRRILGRMRRRGRRRGWGWGGEAAEASRQPARPQASIRSP